MQLGISIIIVLKSPIAVSVIIPLLFLIRNTMEMVVDNKPLGRTHILILIRTILQIGFIVIYLFIGLLDIAFVIGMILYGYSII